VILYDEKDQAQGDSVGCPSFFMRSPVFVPVRSRRHFLVPCPEGLPSRNDRDSSDIREVVVPMRMESLVIFIGEDFLLARTSTLISNGNCREYRGHPLLSDPACKISHLRTFSDV
jgi:hypothetical protein